MAYPAPELELRLAKSSPMKRFPRSPCSAAWSALGVRSACLLLGLLGPRTASADAAQLPLHCAVEAAPAHARGLEGLCAKLGKELGREVRSVDDVRRAGSGVQVIATDVTWYVVLVEGGKVRAFTRISALEARGRELAFVKSAWRALSAASPKAPAPCLRIDPATAASGSDLVYPWAELAPCTRTVLDVRDPWWVPTPRR